MPGICGRIAAAMVAVSALGQLTAAHAQTPSTAQRNAIRQSCASDYRAMCASIPAGGRASLQCLQEHMQSLSPACQSAVAAVSSDGGGQPAPAPAVAGPAQSCRTDFREFCEGIRPGGGRALMCLRRHAAELSPTCQASLEALRR